MGLCKQQVISMIWKFVSKSTLWIAIFTGLLVLVNIRLCSISNITKDILLKNQTAYINFKTISGKKIADPQGKKLIGIEFHVEWENSGTTPTKKARSSSNRQVWPTELPKGFGFEDLEKVEKRSTIIGPKQTVSSSLIVPIDDLIKVRQRKSHLFFWGSVIYNDAFIGTPIRVTEFCQEIINVRSTKPDLTDLSTDITWDILPCSEHNCYDEDCPDYRSQIK